MGTILNFFMGLFSEKMDTSVKQPRWLLNNLWLWKSNHSAVKLSSVYCSACVSVCACVCTVSWSQYRRVCQSVLCCLSLGASTLTSVACLLCLMTICVGSSSAASTDTVLSTSDVIFPFSSHPLALILNFSLSYQQLCSEVCKCFCLSAGTPALHNIVETDRGPVSLTFTLYLIVYFKKDKEEKEW